MLIFLYLLFCDDVANIYMRIIYIILDKIILY